ATLFAYSRDDIPPYTWHGPTLISVPGSHPDLQLATGLPGFVHNRADFPGNFELVTPLATGGLARYSRVNNHPGTPWSGPEIFAVSMGQIDAVSLIQSNFKLEPTGVGNLELIAQFQGSLFHFWFDNPIDPADEIFPWNWFGPWVVTG
ncbi:MAG: hypothetical protein JO331_01935, partial [Verrucomicrobia bacterium]|nr:hypothetical protein [Verrucomicrobiota bacterium]